MHKLYDEAGRETANMNISTFCSCCNSSNSASIKLVESQTFGTVQFTAIYSPKHFGYVNLYVLERKLTQIYKFYFCNIFSFSQVPSSSLLLNTKACLLGALFFAVKILLEYFFHKFFYVYLIELFSSQFYDWYRCSSG